MERFLQDVHRFEAQIHNCGRRLDFALAHPANQVFDAVGDGAQPFQPDLRRGALDRVNRAEQLVNFLGIVVGLEGNQAIADDLQMLFGLGLEKLQNLVGHFVVRWKRVKIRPGCSGRSRLRGILHGNLGRRFGVCQIKRGRLGRKREAIAVLEGGNILGIFVPGVADFQQVGFQQRNAVGKKLGERAVEVFAQRRVERILKHVSKFSGDFREARKAITCRSSP